MRWARKTFLAVAGKNAPAFTVASLAIIMCRRPLIVPMPVTTPAAGAPPHSAYMPHAAHKPSSKNCGARIDQFLNPLARRQPLFFVLPLDRRLPAAQPDVGFLLGELSDELHQR